MHSQRKGQRAESELAAELRRLGFEDCRRSSSMYGNGAEYPDIAGIDGVHIECKRCERLNISAAMRQSKQDAVPGEIPVVCHRRSREPWLVTLRLEDIEAMADIVRVVTQTQETEH